VGWAAVDFEIRISDFGFPPARETCGVARPHCHLPLSLNLYPGTETETDTGTGHNR
jgi:hypothetical protein